MKTHYLSTSLGCAKNYGLSKTLNCTCSGPMYTLIKYNCLSFCSLSLQLPVPRTSRAWAWASSRSCWERSRPQWAVRVPGAPPPRHGICREKQVWGRRCPGGEAAGPRGRRAKALLCVTPAVEKRNFSREAGPEQRKRLEGKQKGHALTERIYFSFTLCLGKVKNRELWGWMLPGKAKTSVRSEGGALWCINRQIYLILVPSPWYGAPKTLIDS